MIIGLNKFKEFFEGHEHNYVIIGGTACDFHIDAAGFTPRATNDIDVILIVEALSNIFVKQFWEFIKAGKYEIKEESKGEHNYYRFMKPEDKLFPKQVELFSRIPDAINFEGAGHLTPIPVDSDLSSLSAILLDNEYYNYTIQRSITENGLHQANTEALICLKAKAFLDMRERKNKGDQIDKKEIKKHKTDIFRLAMLLVPDDSFLLPAGIKKDLEVFCGIVKDELPDNNMFRAMGATNVNAEELLEVIRVNFKLI